MTAASERFENVVAKMPVLLGQLKASRALSRDSLGGIPESGIYVFYEGRDPIYVGRSNNLKRRIREHGQPSSRHMSATFAFPLAKEEAQKQGLVLEPMTRTEQENHPKFRVLYTRAKERVRNMQVRVVGVSDPIEQTVIEVCVAMTLRTAYNSFENH